MTVDEMFQSIKTEANKPEAEADKVTEAEIAEQQELQRCFGLPALTPEAAAEQVRLQRASLEEVKAKNPISWREAEAAAEISRGFSKLRRELDSGRARHGQDRD